MCFVCFDAFCNYKNYQIAKIAKSIKQKTFLSPETIYLCSTDGKITLVDRNHTLYMKECPELSAEDIDWDFSVLQVIYNINLDGFWQQFFRNISMSQGISMLAEGEGAMEVALLPNQSKNQECRTVELEMARYFRRVWCQLRNMIHKNRCTVLCQLLSQTEYRWRVRLLSKQNKVIIAKYYLYTPSRKEKELYLDPFLAILRNKIKTEKHK